METVIDIQLYLNNVRKNSKHNRSKKRFLTTEICHSDRFRLFATDSELHEHIKDSKLVGICSASQIIICNSVFNKYTTTRLDI